MPSGEQLLPSSGSNLCCCLVHEQYYAWLIFSHLDQQIFFQHKTSHWLRTTNSHREGTQQLLKCNARSLQLILSQQYLQDAPNRDTSISCTYIQMCNQIIFQLEEVLVLPKKCSRYPYVTEYDKTFFNFSFYFVVYTSSLG